VGAALRASDPEVGEVDVLPLVVHDQLRPPRGVGRARNVGEGRVVERAADHVDEEPLDRLDADDGLGRVEEERTAGEPLLELRKPRRVRRVDKRLRHEAVGVGVERLPLLLLDPRIEAHERGLEPVVVVRHLHFVCLDLLWTLTNIL